MAHKSVSIKKPDTPIQKLFFIRNQYGKQYASAKLQLLSSIDTKTIKNKKELQSCYAALLFIIAWPDNKIVYKSAYNMLQQLQSHIQANEKIQYLLYNAGITGSSLCAGFSFELVKWLRKKSHAEIKLIAFEAGDAQIQSILSVVMTKTESEILQDANAAWKGWLMQFKKPGEDLLDQFISIFDNSDIRPEVKEELWNAIGINVEISFPSACCLPQSLTELYFHRSLIKKDVKKFNPVIKPVPVKLTEKEAEDIMDCSRMILVRKLRELDPVSFTTSKLVSYYQLARGFSVALMGMVPAHRHPIDSYMGYVVFKNGWPVAYAGSWILFDSARIGLNVFADYRGGEAKYIFEQVLQLHAKVYGLNRFSVDPYQLGKENQEGIDSGAYWIYYHAGFRPLQKEQQSLAVAEEAKITANKRYRSPARILKKLAESRMELVFKKPTVSFDATDLSRLYAAILTKKYNGNRMIAENDAFKKLVNILQIKNDADACMHFILKNWAVLLLSNEKELRSDTALKKVLKKLFVLKASGLEEDYIKEMQQAVVLRKYFETLLKNWL